MPSVPQSFFIDANNKDIYYSTVQCGVFMYDGNLTSSGSPFYAIPCSIKNLDFISHADNDDGYFIYPGFKIICYNNINYGSTFGSFDNSSNALVYATSPITPNTTASIRVFFRDTEITCAGFSS